MFRPWAMRYAIALVALAAAACAQSGTATPGTTQPPPGTSSDRATAPVPPRGTFTTSESTALGTGNIELRFTEDARLTANAGCNTISGPVTFNGNQIDTADLAITEIACDPARHEQDQRLSAFLGSKPTWRLDGESLELTGAGTTLTLKQAKTAQLTGLVWVADTLIQGDVAGSTPAGVTATLVFGPDSVIVTGLCNLHKMDYRTVGPKITFALAEITLKMCSPEVMAIEHALTNLANAEATYQIDGNALTITKGDKGVRFTAAR
jgi:heat shock protein HslJ